MADPQDLHDAVWAKLQAVDAANAGLTAYDSIVPANPPVNDKGVTMAYAVLFASPGRLYRSSLASAQGSRDSTFQVTCAGGDPSYVFWAISKVQAGLIGPVTVAGSQFLIWSREDYDPGSPQRDENKTSARFFLPLEFRLHVP